MLPQSNAMGANKSRLRPCTTILITGASGALGRAIALRLAAPGVLLNLWGRDAIRLAETAAAATEQGASVRETLFDLEDAKGAAARLIEEDQISGFDEAYLVAGIGETRAIGDRVESPDLVARTVLINFAAPAAMASAMADRMTGRHSGRIVLIGSAAGHHSLPFANAYSGSKAGLARFADALRLAAKPHGVSVTLAAPGFLDTPNPRQQPVDARLLLSVDEAARRIVRAGAKGVPTYVTPWTFRFLRGVDAVLPRRLRDAVIARLER